MTDMQKGFKPIFKNIVAAPSPENDAAAKFKLAREEGVRKDRLISVTAASKMAEEFERREKGVFHAEGKVLEFQSEGRVAVDLDDRQSQAVDMVLSNRYAIIGGYAGTGKTTSMQKVVSAISPTLTKIDWVNYRSAGQKIGDMDTLRPAIAMLCTTNAAARNLATKLPVEWADHCMSVHSCLAYAPNFTGDYNEAGRQIMRYEPRYHSANKLPLDCIFIDEAGQLSIELWHNLLAAARPETRIYFLGDMAQLRPTHGNSPMTFALLQWPSIILEKIYRQKEGSDLLDQITRIRRGLLPEHCPNTFRCGEHERLPESPSKAGEHFERYIARMYATKLPDGSTAYDPFQDMIICAENDADLGQRNWNQRFAPHFNKSEKDALGRDKNPLVTITAAASVHRFRVGDKVMATDNGGKLATERRFVNGSVGIIVEIRPNPDYKGSLTEDFVDAISFDENDLFAAADDENEVDQMREELEKQEAQADEIKRRQASHIVVVQEISSGETYDLNTSAELNSLQYGYATTCHKAQGSQFRNVFVIVHPSMGSGLNREWLYTACSRAKQRVFLLSHQQSLHQALSRQQLPGSNPIEKSRLLVEKTKNMPHVIPRIPDAQPL